MFLRLFSLLFLAIFSFSVFAHSNISIECNALLLRSKLRWTVQEVYDIEIESAGQIYGPNEKIPPLKTGFYVFLILSTGEKLIAPKYDVQGYIKNGKGLATHKSLLKMYQEKTGERADRLVVGAGEWQVAFNYVRDFSNRSGNFKSTPKRVEYLTPFLTSQDLPLIALSRVRAINPKDPEDKGHTPADRTFDRFHLDMMAAVELSPYGPRLRDLYEKFHALILESFQGDPEAARTAMLAASKIGRKTTKDWRGSNFYIPLSAAADGRDGLEYGLLQVLKLKTIYPIGEPIESTEVEFWEGIPAQIKNVIAGSAFGQELRTKWQTLALEFSQH